MASSAWLPTAESRLNMDPSDLFEDGAGGVLFAMILGERRRSRPRGPMASTSPRARLSIW